MIESNLSGYVHSIEPGSAVDGPGMRFLVFLAGCSYRCVHCHNPDSWSQQESQLRTVDELLDEMKSYVPWLKRPGGLTVSGGEPLRQPEFLNALLWGTKERWNLHTAIETQGFFASRLSDAWFEPLDLVLMDIKHLDEDAHKAMTGGFSAEPALTTAKRLAAMGKEMWIRHVILPGFTDTLEHAQRLADFSASLGTVSRVELLPFHQLGRDKWRELGIPYTLETMVAPDPDLVEQLRAPFRTHGIETC